jgi:hypothetical protein
MRRRLAETSQAVGLCDRRALRRRLVGSNSTGESESLLPIRASEIDFDVARSLARWNFQQRNFVDDGRARCAGGVRKIVADASACWLALRPEAFKKSFCHAYFLYSARSCAKAMQSTPSDRARHHARRVNGLTSRRLALSALREIRFFFVVL